MSSPAPKSPELSDKSKKYDRQIRLWGDHGQSLLEGSQVCLINANALGSEILKGLVLPGIGGFTIVDGGFVTEEDIGCNFFLDVNSLGQSRSKCSMQLLQELNPDVSGDYVDDNIETVLKNNPDFLKSFDVVIASKINEKTIITLSEKLWELNIPFMFCRSVGFFSSARLQFKEHCVIETHPDNKTTDLRLEHPFSALKMHLESSELTLKVPWLVVLYKFLKAWSVENENRIPASYHEKADLRNRIRNAMTKDEENYEEAIKAVNSSFGGGKSNSDLNQIFEDDACKNLNKNSKKFWILARAVKMFMEVNSKGWLPVSGVIPDMTANTANYINLQNIYRAQAISDSDIVYRHAQQLLKQLNLPSEMITESDTRLFCREVGTISVLRGTKIADEYEKCHKSQSITCELEMPNSLMGHYVALRAMDRFQSEHGCDPGECHVEADTARIKTIATKLLNEWGVNATLSDELTHELCRYGGAEIHSVSAFMGGCVAQELVKLLTKQYRPINNTCIYNAITSETAVFKF